MADARSVVDSYFDAWKVNDFPAMRSLLDDALSFAGPLDRFDTADAFMQAIEGLSQLTVDLVVQKVWVDGADVLVWYDLHTKVAAPAPVAEWHHVRDGKVTKVAAVFDARAFASLGA